jgi:hypothetical protein
MKRQRPCPNSVNVVHQQIGRDAIRKQVGRDINDIIDTLSAANAENQVAHKQFQTNLNTLTKAYHERIRFHSLKPQAQMDEAARDREISITIATRTRDQQIRRAKLKYNRALGQLETIDDDDHRFDMMIAIDHANKDFDKVRDYHDLQNDYGQDYEQQHLASGVDPYYDPDFFEPHTNSETHHNENTVSDDFLRDPELFYSE